MARARRKPMPWIRLPFFACDCRQSRGMSSIAWGVFCRIWHVGLFFRVPCFWMGLKVPLKKRHELIHQDTWIKTHIRAWTED